MGIETCPDFYWPLWLVTIYWINKTTVAIVNLLKKMECKILNTREHRKPAMHDVFTSIFMQGALVLQETILMQQV